MSQLELEIQALYEEGMWVSGVVKNPNVLGISSPTKTALFNLTYQGPCWTQPFWIINRSDKILSKRTIKLSKKLKEYIINNILKSSTKEVE